MARYSYAISFPEHQIQDISAGADNRKRWFIPTLVVLFVLPPPKTKHALHTITVFSAFLIMFQRFTLYNYFFSKYRDTHAHCTVIVCMPHSSMSLCAIRSLKYFSALLFFVCVNLFQQQQHSHET